MRQRADFCWVSADGALKSGTERELFASVLDGSLPATHPVFRSDWPEWIPLAEAIRVGLLDSPTRPTGAAPVPLVAMPPNEWAEEEVTLPRPPSYRSSVLTQSSSEPPPGVVRSLPPSARQPIALPALIGSGVAIAGALIGIAIVAFGRLSAPPAKLRAAAAPLQVRAISETKPAAELVGCRATGSPLLVSERIAPLAPIATAAAGTDRVAVGVTSSEKSGFGFVIALDPMHVDQRQTVGDPIHLAAVVPLVGGDGLRFATDRWWATVPAAKRFLVGLTATGFSEIDETGEQRPIWPGDAAAVISRPSIARAPNGDFAVAFRRGDRMSDGYEDGSIRFGWITGSGERKSDLIPLYDEPGKLETPSAAASESGALVGFAARAHDDARWRISFVFAAPGGLPNSRRTIDLGTSGRSERAVALAPLGNKRYAAVFTEGDKNQAAEVRLAVVDERERIGSAVGLASSVGAVRSTAIHLTDGRGLVLYTEKNSQPFDRLWAIRVDCR